MAASFSFHVGEDVQDIPIEILPPENVTGQTFEFRAIGLKTTNGPIIKNNRDPSDPLYKGGLAISDAPHSILSVSFVRADTSGLDAEEYSCEVRRIDSGNEHVVARAIMYLLPSPV